LITFPFNGIDKAQNLKTLVLDSIAATTLDGVGAICSFVNLNVVSNRLMSLLDELSNLISLNGNSHMVERATVIGGLETIATSV
jgi:hypothetical protein